jgi:hypothetical protein
MNKKTTLLLLFAISLLLSSWIVFHKVVDKKDDDSSVLNKDSFLSRNRTKSNLADYDLSLSGDINDVQNTPWKSKGVIAYDLNCLNNKDLVSDFISIGREFNKAITDLNDVNVSTEEEKNAGKLFLNSVQQEFVLIEVANYPKVKNVFEKLKVKLSSQLFSYELYILESTDINAFTVGGKIFLTTGIINFTKSDDEIAGVIAHELYHNELGHIREKIMDEKIAKSWLGDDLGNVFTYGSSFFKASFNQENEVYCDLYGLDLIVSAGYNGCAVEAFWSRMDSSENNETKMAIDKLFSTHPYSSERRSCLMNHVDKNYEGGFEMLCK